MKRWMFATALSCMLSCQAHAQVAGRGPLNPSPATAPRPMPMRAIDTPYYTLHTDISAADAMEASMRITRMFEEYQRRTSGFAGQVREKFPFFLFRNERDYLAAGGPRGSGGVYMETREGKKLMAIAGEKTDAGTWRVVQHEGFHQFAAASIKFDLPPWANEGLAEYFGEALWTGDGFVSGLISPPRLKEVQKGIKTGQFKPFKTLMVLTDEEWIKDMNSTNYDEAWAMVHFLANADNGKYQGQFLQFMQQVSRGIPSITAWEGTFGPDIAGFQARFAAWWLALPDQPTRPAYIKALVQTQTSFLARAYLMKQTFIHPALFFQQYRPPAFGVNADLWLPPALFADYSDIAPDIGKWTLEGTPLPKLVLQTDDGISYSGTFTITNGKVLRVDVTVTAPMGRGR